MQNIVTSVVKNIENDFNSNGFENLHLALEELNSGDLNIGLTVIDLSGNKSYQYVKPIKVIPPEIMSPTIVSPTYPYTNNSNIMFSWSLAAENIIKRQYQFVHLLIQYLLQYLILSSLTTHQMVTQ